MFPSSHISSAVGVPRFSAAREARPSQPPRVSRGRSLAARIRAGFALTALLSTGFVLAATPGAAQAATSPYTASFDGHTVTITGTPGRDYIAVAREYDGTVNITDAEPGPGCDYRTPGEWSSSATCPMGAGGIQVNSLGGDDVVNGTVWTDVGQEGLAAGMFRVDLGDGNDRFTASQVDGPFTVRGGGGNDDIEGSRQGDDLDGGPGNDKVDGFRGDDVVRGGDGDDEVSGDSDGNRGADLIDGGPGVDRTYDWLDADQVAAVTLDAVANDGFQAEGDNVVSVESIRTGAGLLFTGDDGVNVVTSGEVGQSSVLTGLGGNDELSGGDRADRIDGGAGNDLIQGGYGNDIIVGGPGQDVINGDRAGRCNEMHCDLSPGLAADTIDAVDGEYDVITCGPGNDVVRADTIDSIDATCETVERVGKAGGVKDDGPGGSGGKTGSNGGNGSGGSGGPGAGGGGAGSGGAVVIPSGGGSVAIPGTKLTVVGKASVAKLRTSGITVTVRGRKKGERVTVVVRRGGKTVASGSAKAAASGVATVKVRLTSAGRRAIKKGASSQTFTLSAGKDKADVTLSA